MGKVILPPKEPNPERKEGGKNSTDNEERTRRVLEKTKKKKGTTKRSKIRCLRGKRYSSTGEQRDREKFTRREVAMPILRNCQR